MERRGNMATTEIGTNLNKWCEPVFTLAADEGWLERKILSHDKLKRINIPSKQWEKHCQEVDTVLDHILRGIKKYATKYKGLIIRDYLKQGSCREGLRVNDALEFDCLIIFEICEMKIKDCHVFDYNDEKILGLLKLKVNNGEYLCQKYPWLDKLGILEKRGINKDEFYLNTKNLLLKVFQSITDKMCSLMNYKLRDGISKNFPLRKSANPPTVNLKITVDKVLAHICDQYSSIELDNSIVSESLRCLPTLNIDIVPAIILRRDRVPYTDNSPTGVSGMECPVFAVMKGANNIRESRRTADHEYLWRESACCYEKLILDISRGNPSQRYLMTACRIVKSYVDWIKEHKAHKDQLHRVAVSYYLKNICFHCITLLTIPSNTKALFGVQEALGYFLFFLGLCINNRNLPHFFYGNRWLGLLFPNCSFLSINGLKKNLFHPDSIKQDTFIHAKKGFNKMLKDLKGYYTKFNKLEPDNVGKFEELLGLQHTHKKPATERRTSFSGFSMILIIISAAVALLAIFGWDVFREIMITVTSK